jgi:hypothetical protein
MRSGASRGKTVPFRGKLQVVTRKQSKRTCQLSSKATWHLCRIRERQRTSKVRCGSVNYGQLRKRPGAYNSGCRSSDASDRVSSAGVLWPSPDASGSPHSVQRLSRCIRSWYFRCREIGRCVNSSSMRFLIPSSSRFTTLRASC